MTRCMYWVGSAVLLAVLWGCAPDTAEREAVLAQINDYALTVNEFNTLLKEELEYDKNAKLNRELRKAFLDQLITKELLIQEAKRRRLDREDSFVRAIERYWEATLIRDLMALEGRSISARTVVSEEEIAARYEQLAQSAPDSPPLASVRDQIAGEILDEKKERSLQEWIEQLRTRARIRVNEEFLLKE